MKKIICIVVMLSMSFAGIKEFLNSEYENPNGQPFLVSIGIEKNINEFKYYNESNFNITVPVSKLITLKYTESVKYSEDMVVLQSEHNMIEHLDKYYSLEMHLPLFELFK